MNKKKGTKKITGVIHLLSGTRVGGSDELLRSGAEDLTAIKDPITTDPYLPGSTIKGRLRSEMEAKDGLANKFEVKNKQGNVVSYGYDPHGCNKPHCPVCVVFGPHMKPNHAHLPSRLICRDAQFIRDPNRKFEYEYKTENLIDRATGTARHPRKIERVPAGCEFALKLAVQVWDKDDDFVFDGVKGADGLVAVVKEAMRRVQDSGIGSGIKRGNGEIEFRDLKLDGISFTL